jgi:hypothetical protein
MGAGCMTTRVALTKPQGAVGVTRTMEPSPRNPGADFRTKAGEYWARIGHGPGFDQLQRAPFAGMKCI